MSALLVCQDTYPDSAIDRAIVGAVHACNHVVSNSDIISFLLSASMYSNSNYYEMDRVVKRHLNTRISEKMAVYPIANKNSKYTVWRVK